MSQPQDAAAAARAALLQQGTPAASAYPITFTLNDADGAPHTYEAVPHQASEGAELMWLIIALGAEPLARLMHGIMKTAEFGTLAELMTDVNLETLAGDLDWQGIGTDIKTALLAMPMTDLSKKVLVNTFRDGKPLREKLIFDRAYSQNYFELVQAVWALVRENRFIPPLPTLPGAVNGEGK